MIGGIDDPATWLTLLRASTAGLLAELDALTWRDAEVGEPTLLPGWTRGHLLTHLARNADGITRTLGGALDGRIEPRYPRGTAGRNADIEAGAARPIRELVADVAESAARLDRALDSVAAAGAWDAGTDEDQAASAWLPARLKEVEIHRVDLAAGYSADQWPAAMVRRELLAAAASLPARAAQPVRVGIDADGSTVPELAGRGWATGEGEAVEVRGPDWAVLAWLVGRPSAARGRLTATPELRPWR